MMKGSFDGGDGLWTGKEREPGAVLVYLHGRHTTEPCVMLRTLEVIFFEKVISQPQRH
jgi:hypothetical protein